jgi:hypothetical protein
MINNEFIATLASSLAYDIIKAGATYLKDKALGTAEQRAMRNVYRDGFASMLADVLSNFDEDEQEHIGDLLREFVQKSRIAVQLLDLALSREVPNLENLKIRFEEMSFDAETIPFDALMQALIKGLDDATADEARNADSPLFNRLAVGRFDAVLQRLNQLDERLPHAHQLFTDLWFQDQVKASIADAEASRRYLPELNVKLPVDSLFDALGRTDAFFDHFFALHRDVRKRHHDLFRWAIPDELEIPLESVREQSTKLLHILSAIQVMPDGLLPFDEVQNLCRSVIDTTVQAEQSVNTLVEKFKSDDVKPATDENKNLSDQLKHQGYELRELRYVIHVLLEFSESTEAKLANHHALLLIGDGGIGKTHLFCDIANDRISRQLPTILLLGEKFRDDEPEHQIIRQLMLSENRDIAQHLQALNDFAATKNTRLLIIIDALNEGSGIKIWLSRLGSLLHKVSQYPHIALALSVRSEYETYIIPDGLIDAGKLVKEYHTGFAGLVDRAVRTYFEYYGIEYRVPPLQQEFQNPLFLQTLCRGLQNRNLTYVPTGLQGFTQIMEFFIASVNERLAKRLGYNPRRNLVKIVIQSLVEEMASSNSIYVSESVAEDIINKHTPNSSNQYTESLYHHLLAEGILTATIHRDEPSIRFLYDRFTDHLIAQHLLEKYLDPDEPEKSFELEQPLGQILTHQGNFRFRYSLLPAFAIQIPETIGLELFEVTPYMKEESDLISATISSLIWRQWKTKEIPESLINFINEEILTNEARNKNFLEAILGIAANPDNPFNADFLHKNLIDREMADRDAWWSIFLHHYYAPEDDEQPSVNRLINWAWSDFDKSSIDPEAIRLMGTVLAWFLTSSNRYLRDQTTKAIVSLFEAQIPILLKVIDQFIGVNDPYVLERLFAVAYGCAMRSNDKDHLKILAEKTYLWMFESGSPPPHILLRDYARGVIEVAFVKCQDISIPLEKVRPPYKSDWIEEPPSADELEEKYGTYPEKKSNKESSMRTIHFSVMNWDFGDYIINRKVTDWTSTRLQDELEPSSQQLREQFFENLSAEQRHAWESYQKDLHEKSAIRYLVKLTEEWDKDPELDNETILAGSITQELTSTEYEETGEIEDIEIELQRFLNLLTLQQRLDYDGYIADQSHSKGSSKFDTKLAKRWILNRVFELGWTTERFGMFDHLVNYRYVREAQKPERIGKKYQWIAYHELLARIADNFHYRGESWIKTPQQYEGTWQTWMRDIDPSFLKVRTHHSATTQNWWFNTDYKHWSDYETLNQWAEATDDLPDVQPLIEVINPKDGSRWLNLDVMFDWYEPISPIEIEDEYEKPKRRLWYMLKSYLIKQKDADNFFDWAQNQNFMGRWMPESHSLYQVFLGEFFLSPAYQYYRQPIMDYHDWKQPENDVPCSVCVTVDGYTNEYTHDCSIDETQSLYTPSKWLVENMGIQWWGEEGQYRNSAGDMVCFDPTVSHKGPRTLLFHRDRLMEFLEANKLEIVWTLLGEKLIWKIDDNNYPRLIINGVYRIQNDVIVGKPTTFLDTRG